MTLHSYIRHPHAAAKGFKAIQVAKAYGLPSGDGAGATIGIIELGGAYNAADMAAAGLSGANVQTVNVGKGKPKSDGPDGADGEVMLDVEVVAAVAPAAKIRVYFASNTDADFLAAITQAVVDCDVVSISWGGPDSSWDEATVTAFSKAFAGARAKSVPVFAAAGDSGSTDGTKSNVTDYPASDPNVIGCGGTKLSVNSSGQRIAEVVWDDNARTSATGGGVSTLFPGRHVPDIAGNADPSTGYTVVVDGQTGVIGGTSAVAPLMAASYAVMKQLYGASFDFLNLVATNPTALYDVLQGSNGGFRAGPGRDDVSGYGVPDFGKLLASLKAGTGTESPTPTVPPPPVVLTADDTLAAAQIAWLRDKHYLV